MERISARGPAQDGRQLPRADVAHPPPRGRGHARETHCGHQRAYSGDVGSQLQARTHADEGECWTAAGLDVVPLWYHVVMAMNLRLDDDDSALLKALAEAEHVSLHEAALRAIRRSARELAHTDRVREATAEMLDRWGGVLDRLGRV